VNYGGFHRHDSNSPRLTGRGAGAQDGSMRTHGRLVKWQDDRGFGFIDTPRGVEIFVHVSAFPTARTRPQVGEMLAFDIVRGPDGRERAANVTRPGARQPQRSRRLAAPGRSRRFLRVAIGLLAVAAIAAYGYLTLSPRSTPDPENAVAMPPAGEQAPSDVTESFKCDGRTRCGQMTSCEEATYFLRHCPDTQMDGDGDGIPCERQWCNRSRDDS
jgi:cold shock CspA family protein